MNKTIKILLSAFATTSLMACTNTKQSTASASSTSIANPFVGYDTLEAAEEAAGFSLTLPDNVEGYDGPVFEAIENEMIQAIYTANDATTVTIRKSNVADEDISGVYDNYTWQTSYTLLNSEWPDEGCEVTLFGYSDEYKFDNEKVYTATWSHDGYSYSIVTSDAYSDIPTLVTDVE